MMITARKKAAVAVFASATLFAGASAASAQNQQDGLVNVNVGDVTILQDVQVAVAASVVAQLCGIDVGPVAVLGEAIAVDRTGRTRTICRTEEGPVTISQN
jgi:hypothetical protein